MGNSFDEIFKANQVYAQSFQSSELTGRAVKGLAIVTCMDSRIDPLRIVGMNSGDAKILRNAGARVTDDVLRTLVLATHLLNVERILVMPHTDCRMASGNEAEVHRAIMDSSGIDTRSIEIRTVANQREALEMDVLRIKTFPFLPKSVEVLGAIFDVKSGKLEKII
jgi:carbonic anhydrase